MPRYLVNVADKEYDIKVEYRAGRMELTLNGRTVEVEHFKLGNSRAMLLVDGKTVEVDVRGNGFDSSRLVFLKGQEIEVKVENYNLALVKKMSGMGNESAVIKIVKAPMPGLVLESKISVGDSVSKGQALFVIEAMKMENMIKAPANAVVKEISVKTGQSVEKGDKLVEFE